VVLLAACGGGGGGEGNQDGGGGGGGGGGGSITCQATANTPGPGTSSGSIVGKGSLTCNGTGNLSITTCLDYRGSASANWSEAICQTSTKSGVSTAELEVATGCFTSDRDYKLRVTGTANGQAVTPAESAVATKPTCP
jgi:hypothetical protein